MPSVYVIMNPTAGRGRTASTRTEIRRALEETGLDCEFAETSARGHAIELAAAARQAGFDVVAAAGGDGTTSEVMNGLYRAAAPGQPVGPLAVFPSGSGNDFIEMLGGPTSPAAVARSIVAQHTVTIDLGIADYRADGVTTRRIFDNNLGLGFEAQVTLESYKLRRLRGTLLYVVAALRALRSYAAPRLSLSWCSAEGDTETRQLDALMVSVGNSARTGGGFYLTPAARMDDGLLDIAIAQSLSRWRILNLLPKALAGKHTTDPAVEMATCRQIRIECQSRVPMHLDGEVVTSALEWVDIRIDPQRLQVFV